MIAPPRKKLPAYAARLLRERRAGRHPLTVHVVFGHDWRSVAEPKICINPDEFSPGVFDWHCLAGVCARVIDQTGQSARDDGQVFVLLGELADYAAWVDVWRTWGGEESATDMAYCRRECQGGRMIWPNWWSEAREDRMRSGFDAWALDVAGLRVRGNSESAHAG